MANQTTAKKHIVTSFHNLTPEIQEAVKAKYPLGFTDAMIRVDKPNGERRTASYYVEATW